MSRGWGRRLAGLLIVALCLTLALAAVSPAAGGRTRFSGKTAQGSPLRLSVDAHHAYLIRVKVKLRCRDGGLLFDDLSDFEPAALRRSHFDDLQVGSTDEVHWRGTVTGARVSGSIRVKDRLKNGVQCDSGNVGFSVRQVGG